MTAIEAVAADGVRIRMRPWRGQPDKVELVAWPPGRAVAPHLVERALLRASQLGYREAFTNALPRAEWRPWVDCGFGVHEPLRLLAHPLVDLPDLGAAPRLRRPGRHEREAVLAVDHAAFHDFWRLDDAGLEDALRATPSVRFRVDVGPRITGYAVVGRAGDRGYVQRLAVEPAAQGRGLGAALVVDGLRWLRRWRVREALVNTQVENDRALRLYEGLGFRRRRDGLAVLRATVPGDRP